MHSRFYQSKAPAGESTRSSQSSSRGGGQVRAGTSGRFAEVGGSQGRCCSISCKFTHSGPTTHIASRHCCGGASVASRRASFDSGAGRSPCEPFCRRPTITGSVGFGLSREQECVKRESHTDRGSRHRPSEKSGTIRTMLTTNSQRRSRFGLRGVRVGEAAHPGIRRIRARTKVFSVPSSSDDAPLIQGRNSRIVGPSSPSPVGLANCQKH